MELDGKSAIVTGAASGIGRETALTLAAAGAAVTIADRNIDGAESTARRIAESGGKARAAAVDVTIAAQVDSMFADAAAVWGAVDILVNVAGFALNSPIVDMHESDWDLVLGVNLKGQFLCCRAAGRRMMAQGTGGRIVNIASTAAGNARYAGGAYCAAKAGVVQLTRVLALELGEFGITVNAVGPGFTETPATLESSDEYRRNFLAQVPAARACSVSFAGLPNLQRQHGLRHPPPDDFAVFGIDFYPDCPPPQIRRRP